MPHLRLEVAEEWLREDFRAATGFDAKKLLDHLVEVVAGLRMEKPGSAPGDPLVPMINLSNLKHAIVPLYYAHVADDPSKRFLHVTLSAGNDTPGRTAAVRSRAARTLGEEVDRFTSALPALKGLASVTAHVQDIDRDRGYSTTAERRKAREAAKVN
jgi:5-carboxymethyl-2-hydroxymuconate isomerase